MWEQVSSSAACDTGQLNDYCRHTHFSDFRGQNWASKEHEVPSSPASFPRFHQIIMSEVNKKYYRGSSVYLELIFLTHNQLID